MQFLEADMNDLRLLLGNFYVLVDLAQPLEEHLQTLKAAGYLEARDDLAPLVCYGLTPEGKEAVKRALG
jgi:hypothetical protein